MVNEKNGCCVCNMPFAIREAREDNPLRDLVALSIELDSVLQQINKEKELQTRLRKRTSGGTEEFKEDEAIKEGTAGGSNRTDNLSLNNDNTKNAGVFVTQPSITTTSSSSDGVGRRVSRVGRVIKDKNPEEGDVVSISLAPPLPTSSSPPKAQLNRSRPIVLCGTSLNEVSRRLLRRVLRILPGSSAADHFDAATVTHVVTQSSGSGDLVCKRTLKFAQGVLAGCWVVSSEWLGSVVREGGHVEEGPVEIKGISQHPHCGAPAKGRLSRASGVPPIFEGLAFRLFLPLSKNLPADDLKVLIHGGGGVILEGEGTSLMNEFIHSPESGNVKGGGVYRTIGLVSMSVCDWVGGAKERNEFKARCSAIPYPVLDQLWLLDSITAYVLKNESEYQWEAMEPR